MSYQLTITDGKTSLPIQGASVFIVYISTGTSANLISDANGHVNPDAGLATITVTASGYTTQTSNAITNQIVLIPAAVPASQITIHVFPQSDQTNNSLSAPTAGAVINFTGQSGAETLSVDVNGNATTVKTYPAGVYTVAITLAGFTALSQQVTLAQGQTDAVLTMVATATAAAPVATAAASTASPVPPTSAPVTTPDTYEYVYPNSVDGKYFQAAQARMYIGKHFVDELAVCQWMVAENKIPIYGYRSSMFDAVGRGHSLVQGQLAINFVSEGYMYVLLQEFKKKISSTLGATTGTSLAGIPLTLQNQINSLIQQRALLVQNGGDTTSIDTLLVTAGKFSSAAASYISSTLSSGNLSTVSGVLGSGTVTHQNAVYLDIPFDIVVNLEGAGRTVTCKLSTCFLGANDRTISADGKTLLDSYSFIARQVT